jgi:deoxyadenosine/deoxycytidine kinase
MWRLKDENNLVCDSTVYSNLVFTELLRLEGYMNATEVALTYAIADEHLKRIPDLDLQVVLVRSNEALFANVRKRSRVIEKGQEDYLNFHYNNYYKVLKRIYDNYRVPAKKILWLELGDVNEPKEFARVIKEIERAYNESK